jgi:thiol:disulfide interchange protein DsbA
MRQTKPLQSVIRTVALVLLLAIGGGDCLRPRLTAAGEVPEVFSFGSGAAEVFIFTDYFCPPCQAVEPYLEKALAELVQAGIKVTFVDKPLDARTPLYSRYFLYAANTAESFAELLHIRRTIFDIARTRAVDSESELLRLMKESGLQVKLFDVQPAFAKWQDVIDRFGVRSTPTCIVTRPGHDLQNFTGGRAIPQGIDRLLAEIDAGA